MSSVPHEGQRPGDDSIAARTSDGQAVLIDLSMIYAINPDGAPQVHVAWQDRYPEAFIRPLLRGVVRSQVSQFTIDEVNSSRRLDLELALSDELKFALEEQGFIMKRFILRNIGFSDEYGLAVENKQVQEQGVVTSRYKADQIRLEAQGEADALRAVECRDCGESGRDYAAVRGQAGTKHSNHACAGQFLVLFIAAYTQRAYRTGRKRNPHTDANTVYSVTRECVVCAPRLRR